MNMDTQNRDMMPEGHTKHILHLDDQRLVPKFSMVLYLIKSKLLLKFRMALFQQTHAFLTEL